ncbi:hydrogenase maturation protein HypF [Rubrivivax gelatinosus]|uniref:Kae1-like domain-containing protein n=1 Tax=Rubrivivax gelatinosus TaxID=28068 RepID=UPI001906CA6A|nr:carbamoyltransferase HypF [Rubrivivax gelatinosus]MBK1615133.1 hydrogenase maturation protein HypF [Rubrivivax gelatinosus]
MSSILATGAFLKNVAGLSVDGRFTASALHGDLGTPEACVALEASVGALLERVDGRVDAVAHDLHPDFHSTRIALALAAELGVPAIAVQHHVAHVAAVMAEHRIDGPVIGLALDGFGLGDDGGAWGGEILWVDGAQHRRVGHLLPLGLPGGDRAAQEPWRMAAAALHALGRGAEIEARLAPAVGTTAARTVCSLLQRGLNCPQTTSAGRWFDAAAGLLGISVRQAHEAEAAIALEQLARGHADEDPADVATLHAGLVDLRPVAARLVELGERGEAARGAALFHRALADGLVAAAAAACRDAGIRRVVLGGGCFFNRVLSARIEAGLAAHDLEPLRPAALADCGDAGLARGQCRVAERRLAGMMETT